MRSGRRCALLRRRVKCRAHGKERHTDHDRDFGKATEETRRVKPRVRRCALWADRKPNATRRDHRPALPKRRERTAEDGVYASATAQGVGAFDARCGMCLERDPFGYAGPVGPREVCRLTRFTAVREKSHSPSSGTAAVIGFCARSSVAMIGRVGSIPSSGCAARCVRSRRRA